MITDGVPRRGGGYCRLRSCRLESLDSPRIARQETVSLISLRGQARTARIEKVELGKLELGSLSSMRVSNCVPPSENCIPSGNQETPSLAAFIGRTELAQ